MNCYLPWYVILPSLGGEGLCQAVLNSPYPPSTVSPSAYALAFSLTLLSEGAVMALFFGRVRRWWFAVLAANLLTHPAAVYLWIPFASRHFSIRETLLGAELTIPLLEALVYVGFGFRNRWKALAASIAANFASWTLVAWLN